MSSNEIKKAAIAASVTDILSEDQKVEFVDYFVRFNGIPREEKIDKFIPESSAKIVLQRYEEILRRELAGARLIPGVQHFISELYKEDKVMMVLSGGSQNEVTGLLESWKMKKYFSGIFGGPLRKEVNLEKMKLERPVLYFGDSAVDFDIAKANGFDFVFVYGESNISNWQEKTKSWDIVSAIKNFEDDWLK